MNWDDVDKFFELLHKTPCRCLENIFSGFNKGELGILRILSSKNVEHSSGELSQLLGVSTARVASILNSLENKELIIRKEDVTDKRKTLISITEKGVLLAQDIKETILKRINYVIEMIGVDKFREYLETTITISNVLRSYEEETC